MPNPNHIFIKNQDGGYLMWCEHCGDQYSPALPCSFDVMSGILDGFLKSHCDCPKPVEQTAPDVPEVET